MTKREKCPGTGQPAEAKPDSAYPHCPVCGQEMAAQGRKAQMRYRWAWQSIPSHFRPAVVSS